MASQVLNGPAVAVHLYQALYGKAPSNALYASYITQIASVGEPAFAAAITSSFANTTSAALALQVLTNLNITATTVTATGSYAALLSALEQVFTGYGVASRGQIILNLTNILANLEGDATYGAAAVSYNNQTLANFTYAANVANTVPAAVTPTDTTVGQTFTLTTGIDTVTGASGNDTFLGSAATTNGNFNAADTLNGGAGTDTLNLTIDVLAANSLPGATTSAVETINVRNVSGQAQIVTAGNFAGATTFVSDRSTNQIDLTGLVAGQTVGVAGNGAVANGDFNFTYGATVTAGVLNISGGTTAGAITEIGAGITSNTINSTGAANTVGVITVSGTVDKTLAINAATALTATSIGGLTAGATITVSGAATSATTGVGVTLGLLDSDVIVLNASGLTAGGVSATLNADTTIVVTGGAGNDRITTGAVLTTGSVTAGAGTADRLSLAADTHAATLTLGNKYSGFEVVQIAAAGTQDLDLLITNNTLTGLRLAGTGTVTNANAATAANVTILANSTPSIGVKGALNPGQIDTVGITVSDEATAVATITLTVPVLAGVEILNLVATDNATVTSLASALALTNVNVSGAGAVSLTTTAIALQTNFAVNAGTATGALTVDGTGATTNGFSVIGSSGINTITGGSQVFSANLAASTAKADVITVTNATGGTLALANATISGFTNSATVAVGDKVDLINTASIGAAVTAAVTAADATVTAALSATGIFTFTGTGAAAATLATKIAIATEAAYGGATQYRTTAFEHGGNTYLVENGDGVAGFTAGTDVVVQLTGVTGVTALSVTASGAATVWIV